MQLPLTGEQFFAVCSRDSAFARPAQVTLLLLARSAILAQLWVWVGIAYHMACFTHINPLAYAFGASVCGNERMNCGVQ